MTYARPKWIVFDAFGTLFTFSRPVSGVYADAHLKAGLPPLTYDLVASFKQAFKKTEAEWPNYGADILTAQQWWQRVIEQTFHIKRGDSRQTESLVSTLLTYYSSKEAYKLYPDTKDTLRMLKEDKFRLGVISNSDNRLSLILRNLGVDQYFDLVVNSQDANMRKPDKKIFDHFRQMAKAAPDTLVYVGDELLLDFNASQQAGWRPVLIDRSLPFSTEAISSLRQLAQVSARGKPSI